MKLLKSKISGLAGLRTVLSEKKRSGKPTWKWGWLVLAYILLPADLLPDPIPLLGWLDDLGLLYFFLKKLLN